MDNEQFLKRSEEHVASVQAALQRAKKMIERTESLFRHFGFARGNDKAMFALPFIQKMADDIALIAKGERDYLEFMGFKEPEEGWPTLHLGIASSEEETAIDRLLAEAQAVPLKPRKEFLNKESPASVPTSQESTTEALAKIRAQMDALLASSKATLGTRNILKKTSPKPISHKKGVNPLALPQPISSIAQQPMPTIMAPESEMTIPKEKPITASLKKDSSPVVPNEIQEIFSNEEETQPITLLKASSHRIHRHALANDIRSKIQGNALDCDVKNRTDGDKLTSFITTPDTLKSEAATKKTFKAETQAALPQSSTPSLIEPLSNPSESSIIPSLAVGRRRLARTRLTQEGDKLKIQKNIQL